MINRNRSRQLHVLLLLFVAASTVLSATTEKGTGQDRPDILFIAIDDMNDWISLLDPNSPIRNRPKC